MTCSKHVRLSLVECLFAYFQSTTNPGPQRPRLLTVPWEMEMDGGKKTFLIEKHSHLKSYVSLQLFNKVLIMSYQLHNLFSF